MHSIRTRLAMARGVALLAMLASIEACAATDVEAAPSTRVVATKRSHARHVARDPVAAGENDGASGRQHGAASYYSTHLNGRKTASGDPYDPDALTAAHRTLPLGTRVRVVNPKNDRSVVVTVNDRGPIPKNRLIDVSSAAADQLGMKKAGVTRVETQVIGAPDATE